MKIVHVAFKGSIATGFKNPERSFGSIACGKRNTAEESHRLISFMKKKLRSVVISRAGHLEKRDFGGIQILGRA